MHGEPRSFGPTTCLVTARYCPLLPKLDPLSSIRSQKHPSSRLRFRTRMEGKQSVSTNNLLETKVPGGGVKRKLDPRSFVPTVWYNQYPGFLGPGDAFDTWFDSTTKSGSAEQFPPLAGLADWTWSDRFDTIDRISYLKFTRLNDASEPYSSNTIR
ncbi:hypothetical protein EPUS_07945 [Endocarpon pusillum Z07020]|uniref:Uncharacterized protein n=1 Tax=Endocarpon pusillum (strain Z07020 / HMAS-L-300199) TaxID=1263415 RepID=U1I4J4_ENDPU|nr:uncharacterized protein EPUS_07945 [Endocarpon pusillum Z07020]ERF77039.1 hypothetical protein EPUS_07945 [Endocarpon pusillum Z07020]